MAYTITGISEVVRGKFLSIHADTPITHLVYDSRNVEHAAHSLFIAISTNHADGHAFLADAYNKGIRNFIVSKQTGFSPADANIILVKNTLQAFQHLAINHRSHFQFPVIGITGSNGKTIVKEWLFQLLGQDYNIVRSPKSYNSQIGVPLSIWQMKAGNNLGIFEAGISTVGEMEQLQKIIQPTIGVFTNLGDAHNAGFESSNQKLQEKLKLFEGLDVVIGDYDLLHPHVHAPLFSHGSTANATLQLVSTSVIGNATQIKAIYQNQLQYISIPFTDDAAVQNAITCWCVLLYLQIPEDKIQERFPQLHAVDMRLQLKQAINNCLLINDSYSADTTSLKLALDFLQQQSSGLKRTVILSDFFESGKEDEVLYKEIVRLLETYKINKVIAIGENFSKYLQIKALNFLGISYPSTSDFISAFKSSDYNSEIILVKGARRYEFENIVQLFEKKLHGTVLEINLNALAHNLKVYQKLLAPETKIMAMVKAFSYGSGSTEIASVLQYNNVSYLSVAYADEGVELRKGGIHLPIMVMNPEPSSFHSMIEHQLQPVIYSFEMLYNFHEFTKSEALENYPVHLEIDTGMHRLGFSADQVDELAKYLTSSSLFIQSVFTHLAASDEEAQDEFTLQQFHLFQTCISILQQYITYPFLKHISNSAAIVRHPQLQLDMVRLGIGLYGVDAEIKKSLDLQSVATLRSTVAQVKKIKKGESVSYGRREMVDRDSIIATIRIGYADGYSRNFSNGVGKMFVRGKLAPVVGVVCMDMTMIDVTDINGVVEGDDVIVFGNQLPVQQIAKWIKTIPYEIMTGISQRVRRVYYFE